MTDATATYRERLRRLNGLVVIPTYNNAGTVVRVIERVRAYADAVWVVNDGSTDDTARLLASIEGIRVLTHAKNRGKGSALRWALAEAAEAGFRYLITIDADGQHYAEDLPVFIDRIEQRPDSLLIGARNLRADNMPARNGFANRFSNFWFRVETGIRLDDTQSGFRLYPVQRLRGLRCITRRYEFEVEVLVRAAWRGIAVENVPVRVFYPRAEERVSHFRPLRDFARISVLNTVLVLYALLCYYPWRFVRSLTRERLRRFFDRQLFHSPESNLRMAAAMGWGVCCGILPIWGYQALFAGITAHLLRWNKVVAVVFSNVSIPPMIPLILYASLRIGAALFGEPVAVSLADASFERIGHSLLLYVAGSCVLAAVCGTAAFALGWIIMSICKRGAHHE